MVLVSGKVREWLLVVEATNIEHDYHSPVNYSCNKLHVDMRVLHQEDKYQKALSGLLDKREVRNVHYIEGLDYNCNMLPQTYIDYCYIDFVQEDLWDDHLPDKIELKQD
jgi:hypothetical protein